MARIISINSFHRGTGKSHLAANLAILCARAGQRVGVIDHYRTEPCLHLLFGLPESQLPYTLNDYLAGRCEIEEISFDLTSHFNALGRAVGEGQLFLILADVSVGDFTHVLREGHATDLTDQGFQGLIERLALDLLLIDNPAGINEGILSSVALCDVLLVVVRLDKQDYLGTGVLIDLAHHLEVPYVMLVVDQVLPSHDTGAIQKQVAKDFNSEVATVLPYTDELMALASTDLFVLRYPDHPLSFKFREVAAKVLVRSGLVP
ncbi:MAG: MinD/ParA family protein [Chloroflexota bacterium]|nr:MinD/ParA family protein [Chloroflexota bacterium]